ncbi:MAG TPA: hypothetical protein VGO68_10230 [Pyrinomonadaceae bacterium]|jgi:hypothetical protein|nr:hypothetical protein [Pyrinomonadaceae bacterium]
MKFAQIFDRVEPGALPLEPLDVSGLSGVWINSNLQTNGIARMIMSEAAGKLSLQVFAIGPDGLIDWGTAEVNPCGSTPSSHVGAGFSCLFDFGFAESLLQGMIMKGLLVLAELRTFKDDSNRAGYFVREYFALEHSQF